MTYGTLTHEPDSPAGARWAITCAPHIAIKVKRVFPRVITGRTATMFIKDTTEVARDLEWFISRYPLTLTPQSQATLTARADSHRAAEETRTRLFEGLTLNDDTWIEPARPHREYQQQAVDLATISPGLLLADVVGLGKAQPLDANVLTPTGFMRMGEVRSGQAIIAPDGTVAKVTGVFPQGVLDTYRITFSDRTSVECSADHLWRVRRSGRRTVSKVDGSLNPIHWSTVTTQEMLEAGIRYPSGNRSPRFHIPMVRPADLDRGGARPLDPYLLGVLLGDGGMSNKAVCITSADPEIIASVEAVLPERVVIKSDGDYRYRLTYLRDEPEPCHCGRPRFARDLCVLHYERLRTAGLPPLVKSKWSRHPVIAALQQMGLWGHRSPDKFIPDAYLWAPVDDRIALLQGLMDTDGSALKHRNSPSATAQFYTSSPSLAAGVTWLVQSLGGTARTATKNGDRRDYYTVTVKVPQPINPFRLSRKAKLWGEGHENLKPTRAITSIERTAPREMQCIAVDHPEHLYVTDNFTVTHNTQSGAGLLRSPAARPALVVTLTHLPKQWEREINTIFPTLTTHIATKASPYDVDADVLIMNYAKLGGWVDHLEGAIRYVVFDEVQELRRSGSVKHDAAVRIARAADYRVGLSATPIFNYGGETHNIYDVLAPDVLGSRDEFLREWGKSSFNGNIVVGDPEALGEYLRDQGVLLRRTRTDVHRELPEPIRIVQEVGTDPAALDAVAGDTAAMARLILDTNSNQKDQWRARGDLDWKLRQATGVAKAPFVAEFVRMLLETEQRVVLFGWHHAVYSIWQDLLSEFNPVLFTGKESTGQKAAATEAFCHGDSRVLIMSLRAGAGLDGLQDVCSVAVFGELDWSPEVHTQAIGRLARDGQEATVAAYFLVADEGSDPVVAEVNEIKRQQSEPMLDPQQPLFQPITPSQDRMRLLAETVLSRAAAGRAAA